MALVGGSLEITSFVFTVADNESLSEDITCTVDNVEYTVVGTIGASAYVGQLIPTIVLEGEAATISPESGVSTDFSDDVTFTVTGSDGATTRDYTVSISVDISEAEYSTTEKNLDFKRWYECTTCTHLFKQGQGGIFRGKPYCSLYGCLQEAIGSVNFKKGSSSGGSGSTIINMVTDDGNIMITEELQEMVI